MHAQLAPHMLGEFDFDLVPDRRYGDRPGIGAVIRVYGHPTPYYPGTRETPAEPAGYEIERVTLSMTPDDETTVTPSDDLLDWIMDQLEDGA